MFEGEIIVGSDQSFQIGSSMNIVVRREQDKNGKEAWEDIEGKFGRMKRGG